MKGSRMMRRQGPFESGEDRGEGRHASKCLMATMMLPMRQLERHDDVVDDEACDVDEVRF